MSDYILPEILAKILERLPLKPLIQFRSVSKQWKSLIDSPDFIVSYGFRHSHPDSFILRYEDCRINLEYPGDDTYLTLVDDNYRFVKQKFVPTIPQLIKNIEPYPIRVVGSSHGLLCFKGYHECPYGQYELVVLWNPCIRKCVGIQVPYIYDSPNEDFRNVVGVDDDVNIGFGVCPVSFDPTILKIRYIDYKRKMKHMPSISVPWIVRVFTLSTGTWSVLSNNLPRESIRLRGPQVVIGGFIYWVAFDMLDAEDGRSQSHFLILSFDLTAKEFKEIKLTYGLTHPLCSILSISELHESLVLLACHREFDDGVSLCCLWMMKEDGVSKSFTKLYDIRAPNLWHVDDTIKQILGFRKAGQLIIETQPKDETYAKVEMYDPDSGRNTNLQIFGEKYSFFMCSYMETLLLLDQSDGYTYSNSM